MISNYVTVPDVLFCSFRTFYLTPIASVEPSGHIAIIWLGMGGGSTVNSADGENREALYLLTRELYGVLRALIKRGRPGTGEG